MVEIQDQKTSATLSLHVPLRFWFCATPPHSMAVPLRSLLAHWGVPPSEWDGISRELRSDHMRPREPQNPGRVARRAEKRRLKAARVERWCQRRQQVAAAPTTTATA